MAARAAGPAKTAGGERRGGRPRDVGLDERILRQTYALMVSNGYRGLRIDEIARRSGVPKSTIYRRWSSVAELAVDAVDTALGPRECESSPDPLADLSAIIMRAHSHVAASPIADALPRGLPGASDRTVAQRCDRRRDPSCRRGAVAGSRP